MLKDGYCKKELDGWLVWLRRVNNSLSFARTWKEYENGFGRPDGNFWLGLEHLHTLTNTGDWMFRAEMESWKGEMKWVEYKNFCISDKTDNYRLILTGYMMNAVQ